MLNERPLLTGSVLSNGAITEQRFVDFAGNQAATQGMRCRGVAKFAATASGQYVTLTEKGTALVECGGAIALGQDVITDNVGRAIAATGALAIAAGATAVTSTAANGAAILTGSGLPECVLGRALVAVTAAGQFTEVSLLT